MAYYTAFIPWQLFRKNKMNDCKHEDKETQCDSTWHKIVCQACGEQIGDWEVCHEAGTWSSDDETTEND